MKQQPVYISFLDLVFSLLGSVTILTVILTLTSGRAEHRLEQDYIRVVVVWERESVGKRYRCELKSEAGEVPGLDPATTGGWSVQTHPDETPDEPTSVYFFSPARAGTWRLRWEDETPPAVRVIVETKRESVAYPAFPSDRTITVETH